MKMSDFGKAEKLRTKVFKLQKLEAWSFSFAAPAAVMSIVHQSITTSLDLNADEALAAIKRYREEVQAEANALGVTLDED